MIFQTLTAPAAPGRTSQRPRSRPVIQRKCACGGTPGPGGECEACAKRRKKVQRQSRSEPSSGPAGPGSHRPIIQRKLAIGAANDALEREADSLAGRVLSGAASTDPSNTPVRLQRFTAGAAGPADGVPASVDAVLAAPGRPLEAGLRHEMENRFGHDFSRVRIHTGAAAAQSARDVNAHAYTSGHSIVFDTGRFAPGTHDGRRLLAHELAHTVQQAGAEALPVSRWDAPSRRPSPGSRVPGVIQREVNPKRISSQEAVLQKIKDIVDRTGRGKQPAEANLARLARLGLGFNPGATKEEKDNAFVYTCHCGWIDMGHFFISAAAAYAIGYQRRRLELRVGGKPRSIDDLLTGGSNKLATVLDLLLKTVPDVKGDQVLADVRRLLKSGEPRDIALVFGYWMEFVQQVAKLVSDPGRNLPAPLKAQLHEVLAEYRDLLQAVAPEGLQGTLEGSARSAFTMEDLPSDCYGAAFGQDVWKKTDGAKRDLPVIHGLMQSFFSECGAVFPAEGSIVRCEMMAETTPGSCHVEAGQPKWAADLGEPARYGRTKPRLLNSAKPLCGNAPAVVACRSGSGGASSPLPAAVLDISGQGATVTLAGNKTLHQPKEQSTFGGDVSVPGRPERFDPKAPVLLRGPSFMRLTPKLNVVGYLTLGGVPGVGDVGVAAHIDPSLGRFGAKGGPGFRSRFSVQGRGVLQLDVKGEIKVDLGSLLEGLAGPELEDLKALLKSDDFVKLVEQVLKGDIKRAVFVREAKALLKAKFPQGAKGVVETVIWRLQNLEALALSTSLDSSGTVSIGGVPISGFIAHKSFGLSPLLGLEGGLVLSELENKRLLLGAKGWLYGQDILKAEFTAGVDLAGRKAIAQLHAVNKTLTGNKLSLDLRYQINPAGEQQFLVLIGGEFNAFGSK